MGNERVKFSSNCEVTLTQLDAVQTSQEETLNTSFLAYNTPGVITNVDTVSSNFTITPTVAAAGDPTLQVDIGYIPTPGMNGGIALTNDGKIVKIAANQACVVPAFPNPFSLATIRLNTQYQTSSGWTPARDVSVYSGEPYQPDIVIPGTGNYQSTDPTNGLFNRNTGNMMIPVILNPSTGNITNYFWIDYVQLPTGPAGQTVTDQIAQSWYVDYEDGYQIFVTISGAQPTTSAILLGTIQVSPTEIVGTADYSLRNMSTRLTNTIAGYVGTGADVPAAYPADDSTLVTLDDHFKAKGTGTVGPNNPHGLSAGDIGVSNSALLSVTAGTTTLTVTYGIVLADATDGNVTINLPASTTATTGVRYTFRRTDLGANTVSLVPSGSDKIEGANAPYLITTSFPSISIVCDGNGGWWIYAAIYTAVINALISNGINNTFYVAPTSGASATTRIVLAGGQVTSVTP